MVAILRNARTTHLPICDIHILIATSPQLPGLARRDQIGPCRPWIRFEATAGPHSLPTTTLSLRLALQQP
ncbi:protein GbcA [Pseudomonas sp. CFBP13506]|uniref:Protein GbcA n=1 Tax=Pseudomonas fluorescens TaxID=294 RepID=A0A4Y9TEQ0_PSEFL|nr:protein GbcA [Pseudomonas fluorescens]TKJ63352.1 protein GbcA [Pseudomonas sp. CFBP13506]